MKESTRATLAEAMVAWRRPLEIGSVRYALIAYSTDREMASNYNRLDASVLDEQEELVEQVLLLMLEDEPRDAEEEQRTRQELRRLELILLEDLIFKLSSGELTAFGIWQGGHGLELVEPTWWTWWTPYNDGVNNGINARENWAMGYGSRVNALRIFRSNHVKQVIDLEVKQQPIDPETTIRTARGGGRPRTFDDREAAKEIVRLAYAGQINNRKQLKRRLLDWATRQYADAPDDSTIARWIKTYCPDEVPKS